MLKTTYDYVFLSLLILTVFAYVWVKVKLHKIREAREKEPLKETTCTYEELHLHLPVCRGMVIKVNENLFKVYK